ncbi:hypothetical protein TGDOM2_306510 [Toxoplasma gondii GAB2-2007-GAL-DOM2]|uniref:C3H1-type domain-containing protein n=4 Tax=Toxoplasma gondii TaxID=5811 RepID=S7UII0_TOXGG|nr:hypothetical protein TGGT1_306510 [Toxoplasma gondii GT1]KAF4644802.1 hypothetical protein TGRH88_017960 [Toxoplasma gondii]KFG33583.1 hypothetical protein TGDOM2_306510 [Toxoplasma gondii GAB2-2007-GAL-DOM2]KFG44819.1 hypothetical protein TGFOU_306510 [Toxoplasma gondii FOU]
MDNIGGYVARNCNFSRLNGALSDLFHDTKSSVSSTDGNHPACAPSDGRGQRRHEPLEMRPFCQGQTDEDDRTESIIAGPRDYVAEDMSPVRESDDPEIVPGSAFLPFLDALPLGRIVRQAASSRTDSLKGSQLHEEKSLFRVSTYGHPAAVEQGTRDPSAVMLLRMLANSSPVEGLSSGLSPDSSADLDECFAAKPKALQPEMLLADPSGVSPRCSSNLGDHGPAKTFWRTDEASRPDFYEVGVGNGEMPAYSVQRHQDSLLTRQYGNPSNMVQENGPNCDIQGRNPASGADDTRVFEAFMTRLEAANGRPEGATTRATCDEFEGFVTHFPRTKNIVPLSLPTSPRDQRIPHLVQHRFSDVTHDANRGTSTPVFGHSESETSSSFVVAAEKGAGAPHPHLMIHKVESPVAERLKEPKAFATGLVNISPGEFPGVETENHGTTSHTNAVFGRQQIFPGSAPLQVAFASSGVHGSVGCDGSACISGMLWGQRRSLAAPVQAGCSGKPPVPFVSNDSALASSHESSVAYRCRFPREGSNVSVSVLQAAHECEDEIGSPCSAGVSERPSSRTNGQPASGGGIRQNCTLRTSVQFSAGDRDFGNSTNILANSPASSACRRAYEGYHGMNMNPCGNFSRKEQHCCSALTPDLRSQYDKLNSEKDVPIPQPQVCSADLDRLRHDIPPDRSLTDEVRKLNKREPYSDGLAEKSPKSMEQASVVALLPGYAEDEFALVGDERVPTEEKSDPVAYPVSGATTDAGGAQHPNDCRPCAFFWGQGCHKGAACRFCHENHGPRKKKPMKDQKNLMIIARPDGKLEFIRCSLQEALKACSQAMCVHNAV